MDNVANMDNLAYWIKQEDWLSIADYLSNLADADYDATAYFAKGLLSVFGPKEQRNVDFALFLIDKACVLEPTNMGYQNTYSEMLLQAKRIIKAFEIASLCKERFPQEAMAAISLGRAALECKNREIAHRSYEEALILLPQDSTNTRAQISELLLRIAPFWWNPLQGRHLKLVRKGNQHSEFLIACRKNKEFHHHYNIFQEPTPEAVKRELKIADREPLQSKKLSGS